MGSSNRHNEFELKSIILSKLSKIENHHFDFKVRFEDWIEEKKSHHSIVVDLIHRDSGRSQSVVISGYRWHYDPASDIVELAVDNKHRIYKKITNDIKRELRTSKKRPKKIKSTKINIKSLKKNKLTKKFIK